MEYLRAAPSRVTIAMFPHTLCYNYYLYNKEVVVTVSIDHTCTYPGCGKVLVLDGNMKNYRDICMAKDAGFVEFRGLPGYIKTGCQHTPAYKCRYCEKHMNQAITQSATEGDHLQVDAEGEAIVEMIIDKKVTRNETHYKVTILDDMVLLIIIILY